MSVAARKELIAVVRRQYREADRDGKKLILDELTNLTGYHQKHAIRLLTSKEEPIIREHSCRLVYDEALNESLVVLWEAADRICGKRLKAALPLLLDSMEKYGHLKPDDSVRSQLLSMSAATIDRRLRHAYGGRMKKRAALNRIRRLVPVRTLQTGESRRRGSSKWTWWCTVENVWKAHFVHSLVLTDVASGWTECIALPVREQTLIVEALDGLRARLPFPVLGIDTDNDSAFLNDTLFNYCNDQDITLTRSILISPSIVFRLVKRRCYAAIRCVSQRVLAARYARASARLWTGCPLWPLTHFHRICSRAFSSTSSIHSSRCWSSVPLRFLHPWRCHRETNVRIP
jgi:hypothetical protein